MRKLSIKNFVSIKNAIYEPKWFNIIIGEQTSGKSLIVKLDYFFREIVIEELYFSVTNKYLKKQFLLSLKKRFFRYFNKEIVLNKNFELEYFYNEKFYIKILKSKNSIKIQTSKELDMFRNNLKKILSNVKENEFKEKIQEIKQIVDKEFHFNNIFIPAGRSFFANIDNNIFTILADDGKIDPFLIEFGRELEFLKFILPKNKEIYLDKFEKILKAKVLLNEKSEFMLNMNNTRFDLIFASSGQQEILPLAIILMYKLECNLYLEEPEAHLFPTSQKFLIEFLVEKAYKNRFKSFTITTHSPYIITAINNLILAAEAKIPDNSTLNYLNNISIPINRISAYSIENGEMKEIINKEENLIEGYTIDKVSEDFSNTFDKLLEYIYDK
jgi:predicted ATPase